MSKLENILAFLPVPYFGEKAAYKMFEHGLSEGENKESLVFSSTIFFRGIVYSIPILGVLLYYFGDKIK